MTDSTDTPTYARQASTIIANYAKGSITWDKMVEVLKSIPWGTYGSSGGDWVAAADIPTPTGPLLVATLAGAQMDGHLTPDEWDRLYDLLA